MSASNRSTLFLLGAFLIFSVAACGIKPRLKGKNRSVVPSASIDGLQKNADQKIEYKIETVNDVFFQALDKYAADTTASIASFAALLFEVQTNRNDTQVATDGKTGGRCLLLREGGVFSEDEIESIAETTAHISKKIIYSNASDIDIITCNDFFGELGTAGIKKGGASHHLTYFRYTR